MNAMNETSIDLSDDISAVDPFYRALAVVLTYPQAEWLAALDELDAVVKQDQPTTLATDWHTLIDYLRTTDLIELQERYVQTFDRTPSHSLHLFEHVHGEDRARGQAMVDLLDEYRTHGFDVVADELPDYVPLFLEFLSTQPTQEANDLLGDAIHVLAHLGGKLKNHESPYAVVFDALIARSPVVPEPLTVPPIRDMDEALETFGPSADGVEPLLKPSAPSVTPIHFYDQRPDPSRAADSVA